MPGVPGGIGSCISDSLKKSLKPKGGNRNEQVSAAVASSAKRALLEKAEIKFVKASKNVSSMLDDLKKKYTCLNRSQSGMAQFQ